MTFVLDRLAAALADRYRIERELGQGGMATVYLAHDIKHERKVALKVLKPELAAVIGAERFIVEIRTTASLQHPHILPLFDSGSADGFLYYVMPFIDGETLRSKLDRETQLGVDEAVKIATDVADALHYAHEQGVIHRDIKPENILLHKGRPMVADFGIALALSAAAGGRMTETGLSLGTPHYMSPEQATAEKEITARSDIYSLGSVLYEMLTGEPPHMGNSAQQIIMKIITEEAAPVTRLRKSVPPNVAAAVAKSLEKMPADRFTTAHAFAEALHNSAYTQHLSGGMRPAIAGSTWKQRAAIPMLLTLLLLLAAIGWQWSQRERQPVLRLDLSITEATPLPSSDVVISPDGSTLAFVGAVGAEPPAVYVRTIQGEPAFRKVAGTDGANASATFSPDSRSIAFRRQGDGALLRVNLTSGSPNTITSVGSEIASFLHWGTDDQIVYSGGPRGLFIVAAEGGAPRLLTKTVRAARYSFLLPDGSGVLFSRPDGLWVLDFKTDSATLLIGDAVHPSYLNTGHILYIAASGGLFAVPFELGSKRIAGRPVRLIERVAGALSRRGYSVSRNGVIVYREGQSELSSGNAFPTQLAIGTLEGGLDTLPMNVGRYERPGYSPDGSTLVFEAYSSREGQFDIHTFEVATRTDTRVTFAGDNRNPIWSPDGKRIVFSMRTADTGRRALFVKPADNSDAAKLLLSTPRNPTASDWRGDTILYAMSTSKGQTDLFIASTTGTVVSSPYISAPWNDSDGQISPDGKLVAFSSLETGRGEVWLTDFPVARGKWAVSSGGAQAPRWSRDGAYVYYWRTFSVGVDSLFRARIDRTPTLVVRAPEFVLGADVFGTGGSWDLHPDGKQFAVAMPRAPAAIAGSDIRYIVVLNWLAEFRTILAQAKK